MVSSQARSPKSHLPQLCCLSPLRYQSRNLQRGCTFSSSLSNHLPTNDRVETDAISTCSPNTMVVFNCDSHTDVGHTAEGQSPFRADALNAHGDVVHEGFAPSSLWWFASQDDRLHSKGLGALKCHPQNYLTRYIQGNQPPAIKWGLIKRS